MQVQPYLFFDGRCEEAIDFYKQALGAEVEMLMRFKECPDQQMCAPGSEEKVMHASFKVGDTAIMASDGRNNGQPKFEGFALSLGAKDEADADRLFNVLSTGGQSIMAPSKTFFAKRFAIAGDKFGVHWMIIAE